VFPQPVHARVRVSLAERLEHDSHDTRGGPFPPGDRRPGQCRPDRRLVARQFQHQVRLDLGDQELAGAGGRDLLDGTDAAQCPLVQNRDPVANQFDFLQQMTVQKDGFALGLQLLHDAADMGPADRIQAVRGFVQDHQLRVVQQGLRQAQTLEHALGVLRHAVAGPVGQAHQLQQLAAPLPNLPRRNAVQLAVVIQRRGRRMVPGNTQVLRQEPHPAPAAAIAGRQAQQPGAAGPLPHDAQQDLDKRGLARAVGAQQAEDFARPHVQRHLAQHLQPPAPQPTVTVDLAQRFDFDHRLIIHALSSSNRSRFATSRTVCPTNTSFSGGGLEGTGQTQGCLDACQIVRQYLTQPTLESHPR